MFPVQEHDALFTQWVVDHVDLNIHNFGEKEALKRMRVMEIQQSAHKFRCYNIRRLAHESSSGLSDSTVKITPCYGF